MANQNFVRTGGSTWSTPVGRWVRDSGAWNTAKRLYVYASGVWNLVNSYVPPENKTISVSNEAWFPQAGGTGFFNFQVRVTFGVTTGPTWLDGEWIAVDFYQDTAGDNNFFLIETVIITNGTSSPSTKTSDYWYNNAVGDQAYAVCYWANEAGSGASATSGTFTPGP